MTINSKIESKAPEYRYYTADLLSNTILAEIPFGSVSYERALKAAGAFSGKIPVLDTPASKSMDLYNSTLPGVTALYVLRNNVCVWGGIIWDRDYDVESKNLNVSANEFTSYLYHRKLWKTWSHQHGADIVVSKGVASVTFQYGTTEPLEPGSSVKIDFYEPRDFRYNGYYKVASTPTSTNSYFYIDGAKSQVNISKVSRTSDIVTITTSTNHGFTTGDSITISCPEFPDISGRVTITSDGGSAVPTFIYSRIGANIPESAASGTATRPLPDGTYTDATISVRSDTYDYVRGLLKTVFEDFTDIDYANLYLQPGISNRLDIIQKELRGGKATITTSTPHNLAIGQETEIRDLDPIFDGKFVVTDILSSTSFSYPAGGEVLPTSVSIKRTEITARSATRNEATITTYDDHGFKVGQTVVIESGTDVDGQEPMFNGSFKITAVPNTRTFKYGVASNLTVPKTMLSQPTSTVKGNFRDVVRKSLTGNKVTIETSQPHGYAVGDRVVVYSVDHVVPVVEKSLDAVNSVATIYTDRPHQLSAGDTVTLDGLRDSVLLTKKTLEGGGPGTNKKVTFTTNPGHNFKIGSNVEISDARDSYLPTRYSIASNTVTVSTRGAHNIGVSNEVLIENVLDTFDVKTVALTDGVASLVMAVNSGWAVNDSLTVSGVSQNYTVSAKSADGGVGTVTTSVAHNIQEGKEFTISNVGAPFDGKFTALSVTDTRVFFEVPTKDTISSSKSSGNLSSDISPLNATHTVTGVSGSTVQFKIEINDIPIYTASNTRAASPSIINGTYRVTAKSVDSVSFTKLGAPNRAFTNIIPSTEKDAPPPSLSIPSVHLGTRRITTVTPNTFSFDQVVDNAITLSDASGVAEANSAFNGQHVISSAESASFKFPMSAKSSVIETTANSLSYVRETTIFNGLYTITDVNPSENSFSYFKTHRNMGSEPLYGYGLATVSPSAYSNSFGPYPGNSDLSISFSTKQYSGINVEPKAYRGFELPVIGEILDEYSNIVDGFEYRIDCNFDTETKKFTRTFVLLPINFPNPPPPGEVSPPSRFGADKLVFEYPGSITNLSIEESAENSATRFFAVGETDLGEDAGSNFSVAAAKDLLSGKNGRKWPLLDDDEKVDEVDDRELLGVYAERYLVEARPPDAKISVDLNGSLQPYTGSYAPGSWCSLIVDDEFIRQRLKSDLEPRNDILVRKIDSYKVTVPDGTTFPEKVSLSLIAEWEVDKIGE